MEGRRLWFWLLGGFALLILIAAAAFYATIGRQVNLTGVTGTGAGVQLELPPGFEAQIFAEGLNGPRFITFGPDGQLYVADRGNDRVVRLPDADGDGRADSVQVAAGDLNSPHSVTFYNGDLYVGVPTGIVRLADSDGDGEMDQRETLIDDYPTGGHSTRTVAFLPDGQMVVSVGSSCNVCEEEDPRRAAVVIYDGPQATGERIYAQGLRNAVGLAIHPQSGQLWATNNGRDLMGDDLPPDTVDIVREGADYGWPRCHSGRIEDPEFGYPGACEGVPEPLLEIQAHSAPLGLVFYTADAFPAAYRGDLFIAYHGSWNRSVPTGYKVVRLPLDGQTPAGPLRQAQGGQVEDFATGWLDEESGESYGRPVGLAVGPDGALYVSDDKGGFIYRIAYTGGA